MTRQQVLDLYFMENRAKLIDLGAFLDRVERASGEEDFRMKAFRAALAELSKGDTHKAKAVLRAAELVQLGLDSKEGLDLKEGQ